MIAYGVNIAIKVPDHCYDLRVKGQGHICLKCELHKANSFFFLLFLRRVFIFCTMVACGVWITGKISDYQHDIGVKGQGQIYFKFANTNSSFIF